MLYDEQGARDNIRNKEGKRVFYLGQGDQLTPSARDYLSRQRVQIINKPPDGTYKLLGGGYIDKKPEQMTHLNGDVLVHKNHPVIRFRGSMDRLQAELLLLGEKFPELRKPLQEILDLARQLIACDVMGEPVREGLLLGLSRQELRQHSHFPQEYYGQPHFMPGMEDGLLLLELNRLRSLVRAAELDAVAAFCDRDGLPTRADILQALNRMSGAVYILMIKEKAKK